MAGWIKIYKDLADHWLAQDLLKLGWWTILLLKVNHEDKKVLVGNQLITVKRGQIVASLSFLASLWNTSKRSAERFVELLEKDNMVSRCTSHKVTLLTICNYASYQDARVPRCSDTCADDAPIGIQSVSEIKKEKEVKEDNNNISNAHTHEEEYISKYREEGNNGMWMNVAMMLHLKSPAECVTLFDRFVMEQQHNGETHPSYKEFKSHFLAWARIAITKEQKQNGNNRPDYSKRGRADVPSDISLDF